MSLDYQHQIKYKNAIFDGPISVCLDVIIAILKKKEKTDEILYDCKLYDNEKKQLLHDLAKAFPGLEILSSLEIGDNIHQSIFTGIKTINDTYSQLFSDQLINETKNKLEEGLKYNKIITEKVWDDYKNFVLKYESNLDDNQQNNFNTIFENFSNHVYQIYLDQIIKKGEKKYFSKKDFPFKILSEISKIKQIDGRTKEESIALSLAYLKEELEKKSLGYRNGYLDFMEGNYVNEFIEDLEEEVVNIDGKTYVIDIKNNLLKQKINCKKVKNINTKHNDTAEKNIEEKGIDIKNKKYEGKNIPILTRDENNNITITEELYEYYINGHINKKTKLHKNITATFYTRNEDEFNMLNRRKGDRNLYIENTKIGGKRYEIDNKSLKIFNNGKLEENIFLYDRKEAFYSEKFLAKVRKNELPLELIIVQKARKLINLLTIDGEFIFPEWGKISSKEYREKIKEYKKIKEYIKNGTNLEEIEKYLKGYYKGGYNKTQFFKKVEKQKGGKILFFDIKNLGVYNIYSHKRELDKVRNGEQTKDDAKLNSGKLITEIVQKITASNCVKNHINTIGGDEGLIYYDENENIGEKISELQETANDLGVFLRIVISDHKNNNSIDNADELDQKTQVSKKIEKLFDFIETRIISNRNEIYNLNFKINSSNIYAKTKNKLNKNLSNDFSDEKNNLDKLNFFKKSYISSEKGIWFLVIGKIKFQLDEVVDENGEIIKNSIFLRYLDKNGLGRETSNIKRKKNKSREKRD